MSFLYVKIHYGPANIFNYREYRPQLLRGTIERLKKFGFRVDTKPVEFENYCMIEMCGHEVFRCNLRSLKFDSIYYKDEVCSRAVEAVITAAVKFRRARAYLWFWTLMDHQLYRRSKYAPKDFWLDDIKLNIGNVDVAKWCEPIKGLEHRKN